MKKKIIEEPLPVVHNVKSAFEYYLSAIKIAPKTRANFTGTKVKVEAAGLLDTNLKELTPAMVRAFLNGLECAESTKYQELIQLKSVLNKYVQEHNLDINLNFGSLMKQPKRKEILEGEEDYLTYAELKSLIDVDLSDKEHIEYARDLFVLMSLTGMAVGDLVRFREEWISKNGKWLVYHRRKNSNKCEMPVLPLVREIVKKYSWPPKVQIRTIQSYCSGYITTLVGRHVTPHTARRTFGCVSLELGFTLETVAAFLGHSSIKVTEKIYAKVTRNKIEREMQNIPQNFLELQNL